MVIEALYLFDVNEQFIDLIPGEELQEHGQTQELKKLITVNASALYSEDLEQAVEAAVQMTEPGGACILSPAAASYGYFKNFEERGETFQKYVHAFAQ